MTLAIPTIHLNGTSRAELLVGYLNALAALRGAMNELTMTCPNGRDYYPQGNEAIKVALDQHIARVNRLDEIIKELEQIGETL